VVGPAGHRVCARAGATGRRTACGLLAALGLTVAARVVDAQPAPGSAHRVVARLCATTLEIDGAPRCYPRDWTPALKELARRTAGPHAAAIERDTAVETPGELVRFPDGTTWAAFRGCRPHSCPEAYAWFLVEPAGQRVNIVWRGERGVQYLGPDAAALRAGKVHELLETAHP
jgi:hypothetical protein